MTDPEAQVRLDGASLTIAEVVRIARAGATAVLADEAGERIEATVRLKDQLIALEVPIYGVTTGFGDSADRWLSPIHAAFLQHNALRHLGCGTGPIAPAEVTRATIALRANCLAKGNSGVRAEVIERLLDLLRHDIVPHVPERGSCGASGDLIPLSYIGSALVGEATVWHRGAERPARDALAEAGIEPLRLQAKEGLALVNGTSFMSAFGALAVSDALRLADAADVCTALACEALLGNRGHFNAFLFAAKPHRGMTTSAGHIRRLLADSGLATDSEQIYAGEALAGRPVVRLPRAVQDRYSVRCAPHVTGMLRDTLDWIGGWLEIEINASDDNPLFDPEAGRLHSGGNFYGGHVAQAMDALKIALANICDLLDRQLELVVDEKFNAGLGANLAPSANAEGHPERGLHHGFKGMQLCCSAMTAEALHLAAPASTHSRSTAAHSQDKVSMGAIAARDARAIVELAEHVTAIALLAVCQALDLRGVRHASSGAQSVHALVRERVRTLDGDRRMQDDIAHAVDLVRSGILSDVVRAEALV